jgi:ABC-type Mn2+/Zn2+ transport system permease subunit
VIAELTAAWSLFAEAWLAAWLLAPLLALVGVAVVARGALFQGVAAAQASTAAVGLMLVASQSLAWCGAPAAVASASMVAAMATAWAATAGRGGEAASAWIFLAAGAATPLLLAHSPHGMAEVQHLVASSLVGATAADAAIFAVLLVAALATLASAGPRLRLVLLDPAFAADLGLRVRAWHLLLGLAVGVAVGLGLRVAGLLYVAGCLLLPALAARRLCRTTAAVAWCAPGIAVLAAVAGTVLAHLADLPPAQVTVAILAALTALAWGRGALVGNRPA